MKDTVSHYVPPHSPLTSTEPQVFSNNLTMPPRDLSVDADGERVRGGAGDADHCGAGGVVCLEASPRNSDVAVRGPESGRLPLERIVIEPFDSHAARSRDRLGTRVREAGHLRTQGRARRMASVRRRFFAAVGVGEADFACRKR